MTMKLITDPKFKYTPSHKTNVAETIRKAMRKQRLLAYLQSKKQEQRA